MKATYKKFSDGIKDRLDAMLSDGMDMRQLFARTIYPDYQKKQIRRWQKRSASEGTTWDSLDKDYKKRKKTLFYDMPYRGRKDLIATGRLFASVVGATDDKTLSRTGGKPGDHRKIIKRLRMEIYTMVPYAGFVSERFDIMGFSDKTWDEWQGEMERYLSGKHKQSSKPKKTKPRK